MRFRPCIDIHDGKVKQIVGGSLTDTGSLVVENYVSGKDAADYARLYREDGLAGGHVILLNARTSPCYEQTLHQALSCLRAAPGLLQAGGGITPETAWQFLDAGASHVIVTSYVFAGGEINWKHLSELVSAVGRQHLVLDLSCARAKTEDLSEDPSKKPLYIATDRWQKLTREEFTPQLLSRLYEDCDEFLVHAVAAEGLRGGPQREVLQILSQAAGQIESRKKGSVITYAGGIGAMEDIELIDRLGNGRIDFTVGSALDLFGGSLSYRELAARFGD